MMRKEKQLKTYGRHTRRVVVSDVWVSDNERKQRSVFGTSSELDSSKGSLFHLSGSSDGCGTSMNSTGNSVHAAVSRARGNARKQAKAQDKENDDRVSRKPPSQTAVKKTALKDQTNMVSLSSSCEDIFCSPTAIKTRSLRERKKDVQYNDISNFKVQLARPNGKRKRHPRVCKEKSPEGNPAVNFSDFDDYSLVISDSHIEENGKRGENKAVETSTPVAKRNRCKSSPLKDINDADLSHIDIVNSPLTDDYSSSIEPSSDRLSFASCLSTPSIVTVSSDVSDVSRNAAKKHSNIDMDARTPDNAVVELQRLRDSFIAATLSGGTYGKSVALRTRNYESQEFDQSVSLFDSPSKDLETNLLKLSKQLHKMSFKATDEMDGTNSMEESGDSTADEREEDGSVDETADLSAIEEDEEEESSEDDSDGDSLESSDSDSLESSDSDSLESSQDPNQSDELENSKPKTRNARVNLQKLSESLLINHVSKRRNQKMKSSKPPCVDNDNLCEEADRVSAGSNDSTCTLYMLNDNYSRGSWSDRGSGSLSDRGSGSLSDRGSGSWPESGSELSSAAPSLQEDSSMYETALKTTYKFSEGEEYHSTDEIHMVEHEEETCRKVYSLRDKQLQGLQNSFKEILTPTKRNGSVVPVSAQTKVLIACDQSEPVPFKAALPHKMLSQCKKIGEGVYGEVFRSYNNGLPVAIKIIPIEGSLPVNGEPQKKFEEILPEIVVAKELSDLKDTEMSRTSNFCSVHSVWCVQGKFPAELLKQWDIFHKAKRSENDRPDMFSNSQLFILFEFADCGAALESYKFEDLHQARSVLAQTVFALAVAEEALQFEHRDLHWGNVLVRPTKQEDIAFSMFGKHFSVPSYGVEANIIDFTLSRLTKDGCTVYSDLSTDETLFQGEGDLQFEVYKDMKKENSNNWEPFHPHSNVLWLHYLADKLVYSTPYPTKSSRTHRDLLRHFRQFISEIRNYNSASEMALDSLFLNS